MSPRTGPEAMRKPGAAMLQHLLAEIGRTVILVARNAFWAPWYP